MGRRKRTNPSKIVIKWENRKLHVKRDLLVEQSKYFQALFSGNFSDSKATGVNLTNAVEDIEVLEVVVRFMKKGKIDLNDENIQQVIQVSSYLMIDNLLAECVCYLKCKLKCEDWLKFYFIAMDTGFTHVLLLTSGYISSRFHDLLINEEGTLDLQHDQLQHLWNNGFLEFCTFDSLILFLAKWLCKSNYVENRKLTVALNILENAKTDKFQHTDKDNENVLKEIVGRLKDFLKDEEGNKTAAKVLEIFEACMKDSDVDMKDEENAKPEKVTAIYTVSERGFLRRKREKMVSQEEYTDDTSDYDYEDYECDPTFYKDEDIKAQRVLDICVYNTYSGMWYHVGMFDEREYMKQYSTYSKDWTKDPFDMEFDITACGSDIIFQDIEAIGEGLIFNLNTYTWRKFPSWPIYVLSYESFRNVKFFTDGNNTVYAVACVETIFNPGQNKSIIEGIEDPDIIYFTIHQFDPQSLKFSEIYNMFDHDMFYTVSKLRAIGDFFTDTNCHVSENRKEMIVTHCQGSGLNVIFKVNLEEGREVLEWDEFRMYENPTPVDLMTKVTDSDNLLFRKTHILETEDQYLVLEKKHNTVSVKLQLPFETGSVSEVENGGTHKLREEETARGQVRGDFLGDVKKRLCKGSSFWQVEDYCAFGNVFQEVKFTDTGRPEVLKHRPPPVRGVIAVSSAIVDDTFFQDLEPAKHFLERRY